MRYIDYFGGVDLFLIFAYVAFFIILGIIANKKIKSSKDFTTAGQSLSWVMVAGSTIATTMGANMVIGKYDLILSGGLSGLCVSLFWWVGWIFLLIMAKPLRASGATSIPSFLEMKYGANVRKISSYCVLIAAIASCAAQFLTIGTILNSLGLCSKATGTWIGAGIVILFTIFSGLWGVAITDTVQSVILLISFGVVFPILVFRQAGGFGTVIDATPAENLQVFSGLTPLTFLGYAVYNTLCTGCDASFSQRIFSAKTDKDALKGQIAAWAFSLAVCGFLSALPGLAMKIIYPDITVGSTFTIRFISEFFPPVLKGLIMSALLGLMLTSGDTHLLLIASTFTDDIVRHRKPDLSDKQAVRITRLVCVFSAVILCLMALYVGGIYQLFKVGGGAYGAGVFLPIFLGCFWKKVNKKAVPLAMICGCFLSFAYDMFLKIPLGLGLDGCVIGACLCLVLLVGGSVVYNKKEGLN